MNVAVCFIPKELEQARRWFDWCAELGGVSAHHVFIMPFRGMSFDKASVKGWKSVTLVQDWMGIESDWSSTNAQRGAEGPNASFRQLCRHFADNNLGPFLFCEVDCILLTPDAIDRIEAEYRRAGRKHMGGLVKVEGIPEHLTGNAVYAGDTAHTAVQLMLPRYCVIEGKQLEVAFDLAGAPDILPNAHITNLVQHRFRAAPITTREEFEMLVDKNAVLYHSDKTGSCIPFIREKLSGRTGTQRDSAAAVSVVSAHATPTGKPKVFTYFQAAAPPVRQEQTRLLALWTQEWDRAGFEPVALTEEDAKQHPKFEEWSKALLAKPTVNPPEYERACWLRWIAMATVGWTLTDYDLIPNGGPAKPPFLQTAGHLPVLLCNSIPCMVTGTKEQFENAIAAFIGCQPVTENGQPHLSDMHACKKLNFPSVDLCREYGTPGFEQAKFIHFSHATRHGKLRSELIEEWLAKKEPVMRQWEGPIPTEAFNGPIQILPHGKHTCFRGQTADEIVAGLEQAPDPPTTRISKVRFHISALAELADTPSRKILLMKELRKKGVIGKPKKRKRRKWKMLG